MAGSTVNFGPPPGQTPISTLPQYGGAGGSDQATQYYAAQGFAKLFGRNPTQAELAQLAPAYLSGDPNKVNSTQGDAAIAQYYNSMSQTPANMYAQQQSQWAQAAQDPKIQGSVGQLFQSTLGRAPTADEMTHYGTLLASGQADAYTLGQFLQSLPEYQNQQDTQFRQGLDTQLQQSDQNFFNRVSPQISQQYAMMGRPTSPAVSVAMTDLAAQLSNNRQNYLAQLSAQQYGGNKTNALQNYGQTQQNVQNSIYGNAQSQYNNLAGLNQRVQNISDYNTQALNWGNAMNQYGPGRGPGALDYINAAFNGINAGANLYRAGK